MAKLPPPRNRFNTLIQAGALMRSFPEAPLREWIPAHEVELYSELISALEVLELSLGMVFILPGRAGLLAAMMFESALSFTKIRSFDPEPKYLPLADTLNRSYLIDDWAFKAITAEPSLINFREQRSIVRRADGSETALVERPDTIIALEQSVTGHQAWLGLVPAGKIVVTVSEAQPSRPLPLKQTLLLAELPSGPGMCHLCVGIK